MLVIHTCLAPFYPTTPAGALRTGTAPVSAVRKLAVSVADSSDLRVLLSIIYLMVEQMRTLRDTDPPDQLRLRDAFALELGT